MRKLLTALIILFACVSSALAGSYDIQQSTTSYPLVFLMIDSSDHVSGKTGLSPTVTLSKAGGSFGSPTGAVSEIGSGWYKVAGNATDTATLGPLVLHATATGADTMDTVFCVVAYNPQDSVRLGLTALPNASAAASGGLPTVGTSSGQISLSSGNVSLAATPPTAAQVATAVWQDTTSSDFTTASSIGKSLYTSGVAPGASGGLFIAGTNAATTVTSSFTTTFTGNLTGSVGSLGAGAITASTIGADAITAAKIQDGAIDTATFATGTTIPRVTLADTITTYTGNTPQTGDNYARIGSGGANLSAIPTVARVTLVDTVTAYTGNTVQSGDAYALLGTLIGTPAGASISADIAAVAAKTSLIPASPAAVGSPMTLDLTQAVPTSNTAQTVGDALNAARAQGFGKWVQNGTTLTLYAANGTTVVRTFTLNSATNPTTRQ